MIIINKKGSMLPIAVISMLIMMIIGLMSLKMFQIRSISMTEDLLKLRLSYSAEGCVEVMRAAIDYLAKNNDDVVDMNGTLQKLVNEGAKKYILEGDLIGGNGNYRGQIQPIFSEGGGYFEELFDNSYKSSPRIFCRVYCEGLGKWGYGNDVDKYPEGTNFHRSTPRPTTFAGVESIEWAKYRYYRIVAEASATYKSIFGSKTMSSRVEYYFMTKLEEDINLIRRVKIWYTQRILFNEFRKSLQ